MRPSIIILKAIYTTIALNYISFSLSLRSIACFSRKTPLSKRSYNIDFYFLITSGVCKKRKYCNRMSKKNCLFLTNVHVLYVLEDKTSKKKFRLSVCMSVCLFACLSVCMYVCLSVCLVVCTYVDFSCGHNDFRRS